MFYGVIYILLCVWVAVWAGQKRGSVQAIGMFIISIILSPLIGGLIVAVSPKSDAMTLKEMERQERLRSELNRKLKHPIDDRREPHI